MFVLIHVVSRLMQGLHESKQWQCAVLLVLSLLLPSCSLFLPDRYSMRDIMRDAALNEQEREALRRAEDDAFESNEAFQRADYGRALIMARRALRVQERLLLADAADLVRSQLLLAYTYTELGEHALALRLYDQITAQVERQHDLINLEMLPYIARSNWVLGERARAASALRKIPELFNARSLESMSNRYSYGQQGRERFEAGLVGIVVILRDEGRLDAAAELISYLRDLIGAMDKVHPDQARLIHLLGEVRAEQGDRSAAKRHLLAALAMRRRVLPGDHPDIVMSLTALGTLAIRYDDDSAFTYLQEAVEVSERLLRRTVEPRVGAQRPMRPEILTQLHTLVYSLALRRPQDQRSVRLAMAVALLRKGRSVEQTAARSTMLLREMRRRTASGMKRAEFSATVYLALKLMSWALGTLMELPGKEQEDSQNLPAETKKLLPTATSRLGALDPVALGLPADPAMRLLVLQQLGRYVAATAHHTDDRLGRSLQAMLEEQLEATEDELLLSAAALPAAPELPTPKQIVDEVAAMLPSDRALVEIVSVRPPRGLYAPRYLALTMRNDGTVHAASLGNVAEVDATADLLRQGFASPHSPLSGPEPAASLVAGMYQALGPDNDLLQTLYLSVDGPLHFLPFAAIPVSGGYLGDRFQFLYLTSGRDLLRDRDLPAGSQSVLVVGAPALDSGAGARPTSAKPVMSHAKPNAQLLSVLKQLPDLSGTEAEAQEIGQIFPQAKIVLGSEATESALFAAKAPGILHLAAHGLFMPDLALGTDGKPLHMMLQSALVLAGAVAGALGTEPGLSDGLATALEVASMDLEGTQLVVLSACDTGRGATVQDESVYGLRRAFVIAGAQTLVASLWSIGDGPTALLMSSYYRNLLQGLGRGQALLQAARELREDWPHPFYWAPFIAIGSDRPLEGFGVTTTRPTRRPAVPIAKPRPTPTPAPSLFARRSQFTLLCNDGVRSPVLLGLCWDGAVWGPLILGGGVRGFFGLGQIGIRNTVLRRFRGLVQLGFYQNLIGPDSADTAVAPTHRGHFLGLLQLSFFGNIVNGRFDGLAQIGSFNEISLTFRGLAQIGSINIIGLSKPLQGRFYGLAQIGGANVILGDLYGFGQIGGFNLLVGQMSGLGQIGIVNMGIGQIRGVGQLGVVNWASLKFGAGDFGVQAGVVNLAHTEAQRLVQFGVLNLAKEDVRFLQYGVLNLGDADIAGVQIGLVNVGRGEVRGAQIGLVNYGARLRGVQIGLINVAAHRFRPVVHVGR